MPVFAGRGVSTGVLETPPSIYILVANALSCLWTQQPHTIATILILILLFLVARTQDPLCTSTIYAPSTVSCAHGDFDRHRPWAGAMDEPFSYHPPSESANTEDGEG